ncbi:MAG TPA: hypothetical protein PKD78_09805 [Saprospiraceae bacterium]|nr:hypothetical protein [Saprospiraceae bacterium]
MTLALHVCLYAQQHDNYWIFGSTPYNGTMGALLHFEAGYPEFKIENVRQAYGVYCALCSDSSGNLLFHTNGRAVRNRLHQIMENGDTINPGAIWKDYPSYPSITGGLTIPAPGAPNSYYLIHTSGDNTYKTNDFPILYYTLVDMNANDGLGKVVSKNQMLSSDSNIPSPVAIKHGNGRDWWLIAGDYKRKVYHTFLIDANGIHALPPQAITPDAFAAGSGYHKASPDGAFFINNDDASGLWIYDFDRCTGILSHPRVLPYQPPVFWTASNAFSADGRFLYIGTHLVIYQLDMQTIDSTYIALDTIARYEYGVAPAAPNYTHFLLPELAADGKIYYTTFNNSKAFHIMQRPGFPLMASNFTQRGLLLPKHNAETRCYFPNYRLGVWKGSPCDTVAHRGPRDSLFHHTLWREESQRLTWTAPKILRLPLDFHIPPPDSVPGGGAYNPLSPAHLNKNQLKKKPQPLSEDDSNH